jgi:hypothetical protein
MSGGSGSSGLSCFSCLARQCVTKNDSGQVTGLSFRDDDGILVDVPTCGSGSGSGGSSGIITPCCPDNPVPLKLKFTTSAVTPGCSCIPTTGELVFNGGGLGIYNSSPYLW